MSGRVVMAICDTMRRRLQQEVPQKRVGVLRCSWFRLCVFVFLHLAGCRHTTSQEAERFEDGRGPSKEGVKCSLTTLVDSGVTAGEIPSIDFNIWTWSLTCDAGF